MCAAGASGRRPRGWSGTQLEQAARGFSRLPMAPPYSMMPHNRGTREPLSNVDVPADVRVELPNAAVDTAAQFLLRQGCEPNAQPDHELPVGNYRWREMLRSQRGPHT